MESFPSKLCMCNPLFCYQNFNYQMFSINISEKYVQCIYETLNSIVIDNVVNVSSKSLNCI